MLKVTKVTTHPNDQHGKLGIGPSQAIGGAFGQPVQVRHAAEEARPHIGDPDGKQAVIAVTFTLERVDFFNRRVAHHLLNHINRRQQYGKSDHIDHG